MNQPQEQPSPEMLVKGYQLQQLSNLFNSVKEMKVRFLLMDSDRAITPEIAAAFVGPLRDLLLIMDSIANPSVPLAPTQPASEAKAS